MKKTGLRVSFLSALITLLAVMMLATVLVVGVSAAEAEWDLDTLEIKNGETIWNKGHLSAGAAGSGVDMSLAVDYAIDSVTLKLAAKDGGKILIDGKEVKEGIAISLEAGKSKEVKISI